MPILNGKVFRSDCKNHLVGRGSSVGRKDTGFMAYLRRDITNTLSSEFHLLPLRFCLLFLKIPAKKKLAASKQKEDERFSISGTLPTLQSFFNFFTLYSFLSLQHALSLF
jgi:hypothetical protein